MTLNFSDNENDPEISIIFDKLDLSGSSKRLSNISSNLTETFQIEPVIPVKQRRRHSVLRRMSIGTNVETISKDNKIQINLHKDEDEDEELSRRSNSQNCQISDFQPIKVLGQGAYGKVFLVKNKTTGRLFAQKELKKASISLNEKNIERTISERKILSSVTSHPNIVKLFYALHDDSKLYLLMEYIPGGELFQYLVKQKFLNERNTSFYVSQMAMALKFLHGSGIVYRDLKPENCLLDRDGYLVLTDFGLAKQATSNDDNNENWCSSIIGTPEYCAPEILRGDDYGIKADWWSLGCVTFDLLTGSPPFTGNSHKAIADRVLKQKPKYPFYVTSEGKELLNKLLNKNAAKRFDVDNNWDKFIDHRFFRHFKFQEINDRKVKPPIIPTITDLEKAENFDEMFTSMKLSDLGVPIESIDKSNYSQDCFSGFSYTASDSFIETYIT